MARKFALPTFSAPSLRRFALLLSAGYAVVCALYIVVSGEFALGAATSPAQLATIERVKGLAFVAVSSFLFYFIAQKLVSRILRQEAELTEQRQALLEGETRAAAGIMAASVAHDIKNVLTLFNFQLYRLNHAPAQALDQDKVLREMSETVNRLNGLAVRLLALSRTGASEPPTQTDLNEIIRENVEFMRLHQLVQSCEVELSATAPLHMLVRRGLIDQMMLNLILNAAEAVEGQGKIHVKLLEEDDAAVIEVHDSGSGLRREEVESLFDAFYTTKPTGHGLGLYTVKACAELHHGQVSVAVSPLGGACFRVRLPLGSDSTSMAHPTEEQAQGALAYPV